MEKEWSPSSDPTDNDLSVASFRLKLTDLLVDSTVFLYAATTSSGFSGVKVIDSLAYFCLNALSKIIDSVNRITSGKKATQVALSSFI